MKYISINKLIKKFGNGGKITSSKWLDNYAEGGMLEEPLEQEGTEEQFQPPKSINQALSKIAVKPPVKTLARPAPKPKPKPVATKKVVPAKAQEVPLDILHRQIFKESSFNSKAVSPAGAKGIAQIKKDAFKDAVKAGIVKPTDNIFDPKVNKAIQKFYMNNLYNADFINKPNQSEKVRLAKTLVAYNYGRGNLFKHLTAQKAKGVDIYNSLDWLKGLPKESIDYQNDILNHTNLKFEEGFKKLAPKNPYKHGGLIKAEFGLPPNVAKSDATSVNLNIKYPQRFNAQGLRTNLQGVRDASSIKKDFGKTGTGEAEISDSPLDLISSAMLAGNLALKGAKATSKLLKNVGKATTKTPLKNVYNITEYVNKDSRKEIEDFFKEEFRFNNLPITKNKESLETLENFKTRIKTPEGKKRLKNLGINNDELLQKLEIVEDPNTLGYYRPSKNKIAVNSNNSLYNSFLNKVVRHEIEHGVQEAVKNKGNKTKIDNLLSGLELRKEGTPNKVWDTSIKDKSIDISVLSNKQRATDYFLTGSQGKEKSAFLAEVQQYMMDQGTIPKTSYTKITPEMVENTFSDAMFDEESSGKYLRLFNIMKASDNNYKLISKGLNKMLSASPYIIPTAIGAQQLNESKANGGLIKRTDGSYSQKGLWDSIRANRGSGKEPTKEMLEQEKKIKAKMEMGGTIKLYNKRDSVLKKLAGGGFAGAMSATQGGLQVADMLNQTLSGPGDEFGVRNDTAAVGSGALSGAAQGASMGSMFGPWGTAIGAVGGGVFGGIMAGKQNEEAKQRKEEFIKQKQANDIAIEQNKYQQLLASGFKTQGNLDSKKYAKFGGKLTEPPMLKETYSKGGVFKSKKSNWLDSL